MPPASAGGKQFANMETFMRTLENQELGIVIGGEDQLLPDQQDEKDNEGGEDSPDNPD
jgi:hypothetical protein